MIELQATDGSIYLVLRISWKIITLRSPKIVYCRYLINNRVDWNESSSAVKTPPEIRQQIDRVLAMKSFW
jgi:hypothetical protein